MAPALRNGEEAMERPVHGNEKVGDYRIVKITAAADEEVQLPDQIEQRPRVAGRRRAQAPAVNELQ
jgi:hypothetical protein